MFHHGLSVEDYGIRNHRALHAHEFVRRITEAHRMFPFLVKTSVGVSTTSVKPKVRTSERVCGELLIFGTNQQFATHKLGPRVPPLPHAQDAQSHTRPKRSNLAHRHRRRELSPCLH